MNARTKPSDTAENAASGAESAAETQTDTTTHENIAEAAGERGAEVVDDVAPPETASTMGLVNAEPPAPAPTAPEPTVEQLIAKAGLTGPRVTDAKIAAEIESEFYFTPMDAARGLGIDAYFPSSTPMARLTFCVLVLKNGFTVTGQSACVSPENFNEEIGKRIARDKAVEQVWPLLGFRLADRIHHNLPL